jgi:hypothetical protein
LSVDRAAHDKPERILIVRGRRYYGHAFHNAAREIVLVPAYYVFFAVVRQPRQPSRHRDGTTLCCAALTGRPFARISPRLNATRTVTWTATCIRHFQTRTRIPAPCGATLGRTALACPPWPVRYQQNRAPVELRPRTLRADKALSASDACTTHSAVPVPISNPRSSELSHRTLESFLELIRTITA